MAIRNNETYMDQEFEVIKKKKRSRVHKLYADYKKLSTIERENFLNMVQNSGRF